MCVSFVLPVAFQKQLRSINTFHLTGSSLISNNVICNSFLRLSGLSNAFDLQLPKVKKSKKQKNKNQNLTFKLIETDT